jgi:hypothetical protein
VEEGIYYSTSAMYIYDETGGGGPIYNETIESYAYDNVEQVTKFVLGTTDTLKYVSLRSGEEFNTDVFDGLRLLVTMPNQVASLDVTRTGWINGETDINISLKQKETEYQAAPFYPFPWDYDIVFTDDDSAYVGRTSPSFVFDETGTRLRSSALLTGQNFSFFVENKSFLNDQNEYEKMEMVVHDVNGNDVFDMLEDRVLVGTIGEEDTYVSTAFAIDFNSVVSETDLPETDDVYSIRFNRPFWHSDSVMFTVSDAGELDKAEITSSMDDIRVVPNPYVQTNAMEPAVINPYINQPRRIMFTHLPANCDIKIFTVSGYLVDEIAVRNNPDDGFVHWDLLTQEGLEIAAGIYIYHVKATDTGDTKMGKFAVVK